MEPGQFSYSLFLSFSHIRGTACHGRIVVPSVQKTSFSETLPDVSA